MLVDWTTTALAFGATLTGLGLGIVYFFQKQKLEETQLFERLFTEFNKRYALLSNKLQEISEGETELDTDARNTLNAYFNLCAEEWLFYSQGRILPDAWRAWCCGMRQYLKNERIREFWNREVQLDSHYGLGWKKIDQGGA
jgi:hypothetical protein